MLHHFQNVRYHFARTLDQHRVSCVNPQPLHFIHVVQRGLHDRDAADLHRLKNRKRSQHACPPDADLNLSDNGRFLMRRILVSDCPARGLRR